MGGSPRHGGAVRGRGGGRAVSAALCVGVGACRDVAADEVLALVSGVLAEAGGGTVAVLATVEARAAEPGLLEAAARLGVPLTAYAPAVLAAQPVPHPSEVARRALGTPGVAEAAALVAAGPGAVLAVPKRKSAHVTAAVARRPA
ncbi:cobalamin biosynthesis protein [Streptomyces triculaminicus]|uniref:Cobalamin biosynthesis protein n=1 Tax=Streptomyces triculaminicus TaxID=2816232 RepID=A0A939FKZ5_9ACTN|nr:cobalamin biosynthesis protein [Streptomyces triculaminicus]